MMYYYSKNSRKKIIHTTDCFYAQNTIISNIGYFETLHEAYEQRYRLCKHCNPLFIHYRREFKEIIDFCRKNGLSVRLGDKSISIQSTKSDWKIAVGKKNRIVLYHKNDFKTKRDHLSEITGYHFQGDVLKNSIIEYLDYIVGHDYYRMLNPVYIPKKKNESHPPRKGTKRYKSARRRQEKYERKQAIRNVLILIDSLNMSAKRA